MASGVTPYVPPPTSTARSRSAVALPIEASFQLGSWVAPSFICRVGIPFICTSWRSAAGSTLDQSYGPQDPQPVHRVRVQRQVRLAGG